MTRGSCTFCYGSCYTVGWSYKEFGYIQCYLTPYKIFLLDMGRGGVPLPSYLQILWKILKKSCAAVFLFQLLTQFTCQREVCAWVKRKSCVRKTGKSRQKGPEMRKIAGNSGNSPAIHRYIGNSNLGYAAKILIIIIIEGRDVMPNHNILQYSSIVPLMYITFINIML